MREAFLVTDLSFLKKAKAENLNSGTTALCAIYRKTEKKLFVGWCGDSQALIARVGNVRQIVKKHSPEDESERKRIEKLGGTVLYWGNSYRVNGSLAVSRSIGDASHKPYVSAEPDIEVINLDGEEDFIVLGCVSGGIQLRIAVELIFHPRRMVYGTISPKMTSRSPFTSRFRKTQVSHEAAKLQKRHAMHKKSSIIRAPLHNLLAASFYSAFFFLESSIII
jgi:hypothetical protein